MQHMLFVLGMGGFVLVIMLYQSLKLSPNSHTTKAWGRLPIIIVMLRLGRSSNLEVVDAQIFRPFSSVCGSQSTRALRPRSACHCRLFQLYRFVTFNHRNSSSTMSLSGDLTEQFVAHGARLGILNL